MTTGANKSGVDSAMDASVCHRSLLGPPSSVESGGPPTVSLLHSHTWHALDNTTHIQAAHHTVELNVSVSHRRLFPVPIRCVLYTHLGHVLLVLAAFCVDVFPRHPCRLQRLLQYSPRTCVLGHNVFGAGLHGDEQACGRHVQSAKFVERLEHVEAMQ
eukprot:m.145835 g.145835  ORF g.145835 m.145835 type:complete len:158 (-) comp17744_c0_seq2:724-1197(-)